MNALRLRVGNLFSFHPTILDPYRLNLPSELIEIVVMLTIPEPFQPLNLKLANQIARVSPHGVAEG
jgi:hypothetical protein